MVEIYPKLYDLTGPEMFIFYISLVIYFPPPQKRRDHDSRPTRPRLLTLVFAASPFPPSKCHINTFLISITKGRRRAFSLEIQNSLMRYFLRSPTPFRLTQKIYTIENGASKVPPAKPVGGATYWGDDSGASMCEFGERCARLDQEAKKYRSR